MSTSIELHIEIKVNGEWHHYNQPLVPDHYGMFGKMCGLRDKTVKPVAPPKGLPADAAFTTRFCFEERGDAHTASWLSAVEVAELSKWLKKNTTYRESELFGYLFNGRYEGFEVGGEEYPTALEDFRFVFWFES